MTPAHHQPWVDRWRAENPERGMDLEAVLPIEAIRTHTKTDDVPTVTDAQLALYRAAAFEAAEQYTGRTWSRVRQIEEPLASPLRGGLTRPARYVLEHEPADGIVTLSDGRTHQVLRVRPGNRRIQVPVMAWAPDAGCCRPCDNSVNWGVSAYYLTGHCGKDQIPAGILLGCLKHIAWNVENPGDEINTVGTAQTLRVRMSEGTNNAAWGSGAIELWRQYRREMFS